MGFKVTVHSHVQENKGQDGGFYQITEIYKQEQNGNYKTENSN